MTRPSKTTDRRAEFLRRLAEVRGDLFGLHQQVSAAWQRLEKLDTAPANTRQPVVDRSKCTGCGICQELCPRGAIRVTYVANVDLDRCVGCGACVEDCPQGASRENSAAQRTDGRPAFPSGRCSLSPRLSHANSNSQRSAGLPRFMVRPDPGPLGRVGATRRPIVPRPLSL